MNEQIIVSNSMWLLLTVVVLTSLFITVPVSALPPTIIVVPTDYPTIQEAVNNAGSGDIIEVLPGTYYETFLTIDQEVKLIGTDKYTTIIDCQQVGDVIFVEVDSVTITGFTLRNGDNGIRVNGGSGSINVTDNIIEDNRVGVSFIGEGIDPTTGNIVVGNTFSDNINAGVLITTGLSNTILQNVISGSSFGINLSSDTTTISDNLLTDNSHGIYITYSDTVDVNDNTVIDNLYGIYARESNNILIQDNQVSGSAYGIMLYNSNSSTILHNSASDNTLGWSVYLAYSHSNSITNNTVCRNNWGLYLYGSSLNSFEGNTVLLNTFGITAGYSADNTFFHNNLITNVYEVTEDFDSINFWSQGGEGNYWSDYTGEDLDLDGIGDTFLPCMGLDWYPLMRPYGWYPGDIDGDGDCDYDDFLAFAAAYLSASGDPNYNPLADFDIDGDVDYDDFLVFAANYLSVAS